MKLSLRRAVLRAQRTRRFGERGRSSLFLPYPLRAAATALSLALIFGCTVAGASHKENTDAIALQGYENDYDALVPQYSASCIHPDYAPVCRAAFTDLKAYKADLLAAAKALKFGGDMTRQMNALKVDKAICAKAVDILPPPPGHRLGDEQQKVGTGGK